MSTRDVVIAGAGPVGMTAALALRALERPVTVVEAGARDRPRPGSRAIFIHRASLRVLERIRPGLGRECHRHGLTWSTNRTLYRGREVYGKTYPPPPADRLPTATSLAQSITEKLLLAACEDAGVEFLWNAPVTDIRAERDGVVVATGTAGSASDAGAGQSLRARYLIGADGARSVARKGAGLRLEGPQTSNAFVIADVAEDADEPLPLERVFHYEHPAVGGRNVLFVPFAGHWRVDLQCLAGDDPARFSGEDGVRTWLPDVMPGKYAERITWVSTYIFRQAVADSFTDAERRVLLIGEAAHVFAPFGARGLNSGIADAFVAAAAVDRALGARSPSEGRAAIEHFATTRRAASLRNRDASSTALAHMTAPTRKHRLTRRLAAAAAPLSARASRWLDAAPYGPRLGPPDGDGMQY